MIEKEKLLERISDIFVQNGLRSTSMDDLCAYLKMSKKTLYQVFENKNDVVNQVMNFRFERYSRDINAETEKKDPIFFLYTMRKYVVQEVKSRTYVNRYDLRKYHAEVDARISKRKMEFGTVIMKNVIETGIKEKYLRQDVDCRLQLTLFGAQMVLFLDTEYHEKLQIEYSDEDVVYAIFDNLITVIATPKGVNRYKELCSKEN